MVLHITLLCNDSILEADYVTDTANHSADTMLESSLIAQKEFEKLS